MLLRELLTKLRRRIYRTLGPNYVGHVDAFDKIEPCGFSIHGCIDVYSGRIIWLDVSTVPIANYYLKAAKNLNGIPKIIKEDTGTEHSVIEPIHLVPRYLSN